jgi:hypothetical protein
MCFDDDSHPPMPLSENSGARGEDATITAADGTKVLAYLAEPGETATSQVVILPDVRGSSTQRRSRPVPQQSLYFRAPNDSQSRGTGRDMQWFALRALFVALWSRTARFIPIQRKPGNIRANPHRAGSVKVRTTLPNSR